MYGEEHLSERLNAIDRLNDIHDECPEFFTARFVSETWERMMYQYDACIAEGIHFILGQYDEGITMEKIRRYALSPDANNSTAWKFTPIFDMGDPQGFWQSVILVEIQQQRQRQDISTLVAARGKGTYERKGKVDGRVGGSEEKPRVQYPVGSNLTSLERKIGYAHKPLGKHGATLCFNYSAHSGCLKGDQ